MWKFRIWYGEEAKEYMYYIPFQFDISFCLFISQVNSAVAETGKLNLNRQPVNDPSKPVSLIDIV